MQEFLSTPWPAGSTGTGRNYVRNFADATRVAVELIVEAVGGTPTLSYQVQGLRPGGDPTVAADWYTLSVLDPDASVATTNAPPAVTAVGKTTKYIDGLALRFFDAIAVNVTANTNVTFRTNIYRADRV
jgi:hypothetical protein